jgi:hypothetical protein
MQSYGAPKLRESQLYEFRNSHLGVMGQNAIWIERHKIYYKRESGGFFQVWAMVNLVSPRLRVARPSTKRAPTMH